MKHTDPSVEPIKIALDQQTIDDETRRELAKARLQALESVEESRSIFYRPVLLAFASVAVVVVTINLVFQPGDQEIKVDNIEAFEIITSEQSLELYEELEFYVWLDGQLPG